MGRSTRYLPFLTAIRFYNTRFFGFSIQKTNKSRLRESFKGNYWPILTSFCEGALRARHFCIQFIWKGGR